MSLANELAEYICNVIGEMDAPARQTIKSYLADALEKVEATAHVEAYQAGRKAGLGEAVEAVKAMEVDTDNGFVNTVQVGMKRAILMRLREALAGGGEGDS